MLRNPPDTKYPFYSYTKSRNEQGLILKEEFEQLIKKNDPKVSLKSENSTSNSKVNFDLGKFVKDNIIYHLEYISIMDIRIPH